VLTGVNRPLRPRSAEIGKNLTTTQRYAHLQTSFDDDIERIGKGQHDEC